MPDTQEAPHPAYLLGLLILQGLAQVPLMDPAGLRLSPELLQVPGTLSYSTSTL